jgi:hypothetical protein
MRQAGASAELRKEPGGRRGTESTTFRFRKGEDKTLPGAVFGFLAPPPSPIDPPSMGR